MSIAVNLKILPQRRLREVAVICLIAFLIVLFWRTEGTSDTTIYLNAMKVLDRIGLVEGYRLNRHFVQYPPLSSIVLYLTKKAAWFSDLTMLKLALLAFQVAGGY